MISKREAEMIAYDEIPVAIMMEEADYKSGQITCTDPRKSPSVQVARSEDGKSVRILVTCVLPEK
jgi:hypothetical protein